MQLGAAVAEHLADQESAVAFLRPSATAQQSQPVIVSALKQAVDGLLERWLPRHLPVEGVPAGVVVLVALGTAAER